MTVHNTRRSVKRKRGFGNGPAKDARSDACGALPVKDKCRHAQKGDRRLAIGFRRLARVEPLLTTAIALLLDGRQWEALRSERVFDAITQRVERIAAAQSRANAGAATTPADLAQTVISRIGDLKLFRKFVAARGTPADFMKGVFGYQVRDAIRSAKRLKHMPHPSAALDVLPTRWSGPRGNLAWSIEDLRDCVLLLPPEQRSAVIQRHPELGLDHDSAVRPHNLSTLYRCGLARLREILTRIDDRS